MTDIIFISIAHYEELHDHLIKELNQEYKLQSKILNFSKSAPSQQLALNWSKHTQVEINNGLKILDLLNEHYQDFDINRAISVDRFIKSRFKRKRWINRFAILLSRYDDILNQNNPKLVIGEISTAIEYCLYFLTQFRGYKYRHFLNLPTQYARTIFFEYDHRFDLTQYDLDQGNHDLPINYSEAVRRVGLAKKNFMLALNSLRYSLNYYDYRKNILFKINYLNKIVYRFLYNIFEQIFAKNLNFLDKLKNKHKLYFPLHVQPESTPDYVSLYFNDQLNLALEIANDLDQDSLLLIKEHPSSTSIRSIFKLFKLIINKKIVILKTNENSNEIAKKSQVIITIAGSVAHEAYLLNKPTLLFSNIFYNEYPNTIDARGFSFFSAMNKVKKSTGVKTNFDIEKFGYPGFYHSPIIFEEVLDKENIKALCKAIDHYASL